MTIMNLRRGSVVMALRDLDIDGACVFKGDVGVVFDVDACNGATFGPVVRWLKTQTNLSTFVVAGGVCNVYDGDVQVIDEEGN